MIFYPIAAIYFGWRGYGWKAAAVIAAAMLAVSVNMNIFRSEQGVMVNWPATFAVLAFFEIITFGAFWFARHARQQYGRPL